MDDVFKALADPTRRDLLDRLRQQDGQTLSQLCAGLAMSRQAASRHLAVLEAAELVVASWQGREKLHHLNRMPLQQVYDRWIAQYHQPHLAALSGLRQTLEREPMTDSNFVYSLYIDAPVERIWTALTDGAFTRQYWSGRQIQSDWTTGAAVEILTEDGTVEVTGTVLEASPHSRLHYTWNSRALGGPETNVLFELKPMAGSVQLLVTHGPLAADSRVRDGWVAILSSLKSWLETGKPLAATQAWPRQARSA